MAYKILENNHVEIENIDGGALNNFIAGNRSGIIGSVLNECTMSATGNTVIISTGLLVIHGIRVKITAPESIVMSSAPASNVKYQLVAQVVLSPEAVATFSILARTPEPLVQDNLFVDGGGTYQIELGRFVHKTDGSVDEAERTASVLKGGSGIEEAPESGAMYARTENEWKEISQTTVHYFDSLYDASNALKNNDFSVSSQSQTETSQIKVTITSSATVIDMLTDIVIVSTTAIYNSVIFNTNGHNIELLGDARLGFAASAQEVTMNCGGSSIFRTDTQTETTMAIQVSCSNFTLNDCTIIDYNSSVRHPVTNTIQGGCIGIGINKANNITNINNCDIRCAGRYRSIGIYSVLCKQLNIDNSNSICCTLLGHSEVYDVDQPLSIAVQAGYTTEEINIYGGNYSAECMATSFGAQKVRLVDAVFESCDHGAYFSNPNSSAYLCTFRYCKWSSLLCADVEFPFKDGENKKKAYYSPELVDYGNPGIMYIGGSACSPKVAIFSCTEESDNDRGRINLSTNYSYKNNYLFLSGYSVVNRIRVDGDVGGNISNLIVGDGVVNLETVGPGAQGIGYVNTTDFSTYKFYSIDNYAEIVELIKLKKSLEPGG